MTKEKFTTVKKTVSINSVSPNRWNPNQQTKAMFEKGLESFKTFGMMGSILVRETAGAYEILDGEHRWKYAKELGYENINVESVGEMEDSQAKVLTILLNNLRGKDDIEKRAAILESLNAGQLQLLPFTAEEIENEKNLFKFDFSQYETTDPGIPADTLAYVLSFKFTDEEWKVVQKAVSLAKEEGDNEKQMFMEMLKQYLQIRLGANSNDTQVEF